MKGAYDKYMKQSVQCLSNIYLVKHPNLTISCRLWYAMAIVMEKDSLWSGIFAASITKLLNFLHSWI